MSESFILKEIAKLHGNLQVFSGNSEIHLTPLQYSYILV